MKKRYLFLVLIMVFCLSAIARPGSTKYLYSYIKVWGFLKYYHPNFGSGQKDPDAIFLRHIEEIRNAGSTAYYGQVLQSLLAELDPVDILPVERDTIALFRRNDHTGWINTDPLLPAPVKKQLALLRAQGYRGSVHQYMPANFFASTIPAEKGFDSIRYPNTGYQLLSLARYWNAVEYLFAYKYMISKSWDRVLLEQLPAFAASMTRAEFEKHLLQLNAAIEDTHGGILSIRDGAIVYGAYYPPFAFRFAGDSIVVTDYIDTAACKAQDIQRGDVITHLRGKTIAANLGHYGKFVSASNMPAKKKLLASLRLLFPFRGPDSLLSVKCWRGEKSTDKQLVLQKPNEAFSASLSRLYRLYTGNGSSTQNDFVLRSVTKEIAWVDAANLSILYNNTADDRMIDSVMQLMRQHEKAILLDLRCYSTQAVFYNKFLPALGRKLQPFAVLRAHYNRYPGTYYTRDIYREVSSFPLLPAYTGKLVLLVNEETQSQSELISMILQASGSTLVVGTQTAGCDGDLVNMPLPGGYMTSFSGRHIAYADGTQTQKSGIRIDVQVVCTTTGIASKTDEILAAALKKIR